MLLLSHENKSQDLKAQNEVEMIKMKKVTASNIEDFIAKQDDPEWRREIIEDYVEKYNWDKNTVSFGKQLLEGDYMIFPPELVKKHIEMDDRRICASDDYTEIDIVPGNIGETRIFYQRLIGFLKELPDFPVDECELSQAEGIALANAENDPCSYVQLSLDPNGEMLKYKNKGTEVDQSEFDQIGFPYDKGHASIRLKRFRSPGWHEFYKPVVNFLRENDVSFVMQSDAGILAYHVAE